jgi:hypothetical protein
VGQEDGLLIVSAFEIRAPKVIGAIDDVGAIRGHCILLSQGALPYSQPPTPGQNQSPVITCYVSIRVRCSKAHQAGANAVAAQAVDAKPLPCDGGETVGEAANCGGLFMRHLGAHYSRQPTEAR